MNKDAPQEVDALRARNEELEHLVAEQAAQIEAARREAKIEAALERVRARTMAMHRSDELAEVAAVIFQQLDELGLAPERSFIGILQEAKGTAEIWVTTQGGAYLPERFSADLDEPTGMAKIYEAWKNDVSTCTIVLRGEELTQWVRYVRERMGMPLQEAYLQESRVHSVATFPQGFLGITTPTARAAEDVAILKRFARVFEQTYTRFLDLKKAEEQAREAQIEAALERVRARTMAMHESEELADVISGVFEQLQSLGFDVSACQIVIARDKDQSLQWWGATAHQAKIAHDALIPFINHPLVTRFWEARQQGETFLTDSSEGKEKDSFFEFLFEHAGFKNTPAERKKYIFESKKIARSYALMRHGGLGIQNYDGVPYSEEENDILKRFARVFEQTYTRFLDLKKAEEQAREAEIEAALERVRSRTMGMHHSDELAEVAVVLFEQLHRLGVTPDRALIPIVDEQTATAVAWMTTQGGEQVSHGIKVIMTGHPVLEEVYERWKRKDPFIVQDLSGEALTDFLEWIQRVSDTPYTEIPERRVYGYASFSHGMVAIVQPTPISEETQSILTRFARVFEQTYTRFLDLKKAEEQAREAETEAALERVRARAMAMHRSDELAEAAELLHRELMALGINPWSSGYTFLDEETGQGLVWLMNTEPDGPVFLGSWSIPSTEDPVLQHRYASWKRQEELLRVELEGDANVEHGRYVARYTPQTEEELLATLPERLVFYTANFSHGYLIVVSTEPIAVEEEQTLVRFAKVFEMTYTRFLDLKKAEEQAREAQIEAALERVRSRAMGMQQSDELASVVTLLFYELRNLGHSMLRCGIGLVNDDESEINIWTAAASGDVDSLQVIGSLPLKGLHHLEGLYDAWKRQADTYTYDLTGEALARHLEILTVRYDLPESGLVPDRQVTLVCPFSQGCLFVTRREPLPDPAVRVVRRFTDVFSFAYARHLDLQEAETRAREATRQAALDHVRAEIASMRTAADLRRITPLVWHELTTLGVPFFRCGVFIIDEANEITHSYLSKPDGTALAALHLPFDSTTLVQEVLASWRSSQVYTDQWNHEQYAAWVTAMVEQGHIDAVEAYQGGEDPVESLALHFVPFTQGMLYVGSAAPLAEDQIDLVQALADAFAVAYARYEDFQRLEAKNREVQAAFEELRTTQQQLIHAEKMASLGALTAGIAHEIKNPLNFINNFSEIAVELTEELNDEIEENLDKPLSDIAVDFRKILADLKLNAEQVVKHGKRADGIVRSMMLHARSDSGAREATDVNALVKEYVGLAYHGMRAQTPGFNVSIEQDLGEDVGQVDAVPQEIGRVLLNLLNNAFDAVHEKATSVNGRYAPAVRVSTRRTGDAVTIRVEDNGPGIPDDVRAKIFEPFFTTKPTGSGTGLGLSLSYDIVTQGHGGTLTVESEEGEGVAFVVTLPPG